MTDVLAIVPEDYSCDSSLVEMESLMQALQAMEMEEQGALLGWRPSLTAR